MDLENIIKKDLETYNIDNYQFLHKNYYCSLKRVHKINWCGYVEVPIEHPFYNLSYDGVELIIKDNNIESVHGGLTFSNKGKFGFDTCHPGDYTWFNYYNPSKNYKFWTYEMVMKEIYKLINIFEKFELK